MANQSDGEHVIEIGADRPSSAPTNNQTSSPSPPTWSSPFDSGLWISLQFTLGVIQTVASIAVLWVSKRHGDPDPRLVSWVLGYASGCFLMLPLLYCRYRIRGNPNLLLYGIVQVLKMSLSSFFALWFVIGNIWMFATSSSGNHNARLEALCLVFLASGCIIYAMPVMRYATFCLLLPCLIWPILDPPEEEARGDNPGSSFTSLPTYQFKVKENGTGESNGVLAAGTEKERAISGEDAVCCICLGKYADNDEVRELPCSHFFHVECVDKWLKINARCPLCQSELGSSGVASALATADSSQNQSERMTADTVS